MGCALADWQLQWGRQAGLSKVCCGSTRPGIGARAIALCQKRGGLLDGSAMKRRKFLSVAAGAAGYAVSGPATARSQPVILAAGAVGRRAVRIAELEIDPSRVDA